MKLKIAVAGVVFAFACTPEAQPEPDEGLSDRRSELFSSRS